MIPEEGYRIKSHFITKVTSSGYKKELTIVYESLLIKVTNKRAAQKLTALQKNVKKEVQNSSAFIV